MKKRPKLATERKTVEPKPRVKHMKPLHEDKPSTKFYDTPESTKSTDMKFGFSTLQYKKLQIIKTTRNLTMRVLLEITRTMSNRFYDTVMKAYLHILRIVRGKELDQNES